MLWHVPKTNPLYFIACMHAAASNPGALPYRKTLAIFQLNTELTKEKIREYLQIIEDLGEITVDESADQIRVRKVET